MPNIRKMFLEQNCYSGVMAEWGFFTNHARVLVCIAQDPGVRLRDIAAALDITERSVFGIVADLTQDGYVVKEKDGRRNRYRIEADLPIRRSVGRGPTIGDVLAVLVEPEVHTARSSGKEALRGATRTPSARRG